MLRRSDIPFKLPSAYVSFAILALGNIILNLLLPANQGTMAAYHLNEAEYRILVFLVELPVAAIWFTAFYGYNALRKYAHLIENTHEGPAFSRIATGLAWLAWGSPLTSILAVILYALVHSNVHLYIGALIINHYASLLISLVAFIYIATGAHRLTRHGERVTMNQLRIVLLLFTVLGVLYTSYVVSQEHNGDNTYHMPMWLILLTIIVPYLYAWFMGLIAAGDVLLHRQKAKGLLYKRGLSYLASGITVVIASSIFISMLTSGSRYLTRLNLNAILVLVYLLLVINGLGFILVALGAKRLKKIEEV